MIEGKVLQITATSDTLFALTDRGTIYSTSILEPEWIIFETRESEKAIKLSQLKAQVTKYELEVKE